MVSLVHLFLIFNESTKQTLKYILFSTRKYFANCVFHFHLGCNAVHLSGWRTLFTGPRGFFGCGHMGACGYICAHTCGPYLCTHVCTSVNPHVCRCVYTDVKALVQVYMCVRQRVHVFGVFVCVCVCECVCVCGCACSCAVFIFACVCVCTCVLHERASCLSRWSG